MSLLGFHIDVKKSDVYDAEIYCAFSLDGETKIRTEFRSGHGSENRHLEDRERDGNNNLTQINVDVQQFHAQPDFDFQF
jgi:hypothetical protein